MNEAGKGGILGKVTSVLKVVVSISHSVGNALVPQYPVKNSAIKIVSEVASGTGLISSLFFPSTVQSGFGALGAGSLSATDTRGFGAKVAVILFLSSSLCLDGTSMSSLWAVQEILARLRFWVRFLTWRRMLRVSRMPSQSMMKIRTLFWLLWR
jgi:hypothetical protein